MSPSCSDESAQAEVGQLPFHRGLAFSESFIGAWLLQLFCCLIQKLCWLLFEAINSLYFCLTKHEQQLMANWRTCNQRMGPYILNREMSKSCLSDWQLIVSKEINDGPEFYPLKGCETKEVIEWHFIKIVDHWVYSSVKEMKDGSIDRSMTRANIRESLPRIARSNNYGERKMLRCFCFVYCFAFWDTQW